MAQVGRSIPSLQTVHYRRTGDSRDCFVHYNQGGNSVGGHLWPTSARAGDEGTAFSAPPAKWLAPHACKQKFGALDPIPSSCRQRAIHFFPRGGLCAEDPSTFFDGAKRQTYLHTRGDWGQPQISSAAEYFGLPTRMAAAAGI